MHNITEKDLAHTVNNDQKGHVLDYNYDNELHPNAPNKIAETGKAIPREYIYDGNGNPTGYTEEKSFRKMTWDEEKRLTSSRRHYLAPKSWSAIYNGHSIDNSIENLQRSKGLFDRTWDVIKEAITPPASLR